MLINLSLTLHACHLNVMNIQYSFLLDVILSLTKTIKNLDSSLMYLECNEKQVDGTDNTTKADFHH